MAPEHPLLDSIVTADHAKEVDEYRQWAVHQNEIDRLSVSKEKTGVFTGAYVINPANGEEIPVWVSDYVLMTYGTGLVMAVPAHDERDYEFASKFGLRVRRVITPEKGMDPPLTEAYTGSGFMLNSGDSDGMDSDAFKEAIVKRAEKEGFGESKINFRLRDWLISRQRYWGAPIPIVYCDKCGEVPLDEKDLPLELPYDVVFDPTGESPLAKHPDFKHTVCPRCGGKALREVDTMDTFVDSSWYFLRYPDPKLKDMPFSPELINKWLPVDKYVGGAEHSVMHLLYARFFTMALKDMGYLDFEEPFLSLRHQGIILGPDGNKMSKSKGNTVVPDIYISQYGTDVFRMYLMFAFDFAVGGPWDDSTIKAVDRFLDRVWRLVCDDEWCAALFRDGAAAAGSGGPREDALEIKLNQTIKGVTEDTEEFHFNTAISKIMELNNEIYKYVQEINDDKRDGRLLKKVILDMIRLLAPFAPHLMEELWEITGGAYSVFDCKWPEYDTEKLTADTVRIAVQFNGKVRYDIEVATGADKESLRQTALEDPRAAKYTEGKEIVKVIIVPGRIVNVVIK